MLTANAREQMIEQQVRAWDVLDERVLGIFRRCPASSSRRSSNASALTLTPRLPLGTWPEHVAPECRRTTVTGVRAHR